LLLQILRIVRANLLMPLYLLLHELCAARG
jgi:hypothetical protein